MKKLFMLILCVVMAAVMAGCGGEKKAAPATAEAPKEQVKVLHVATDANYPPFEYYQEKTKVHTGFDIELMNALGKEMGYDKVEFINVEFKDILQGLSEKKYDAAIAGIDIFHERQKIVSFSAPYAHDAYRVIVAKDSKQNSDLKGKTVAVENGSYAADLALENGAGKIENYTGVEKALQALHEGRADCVVAQSLVAGFFIAHGYGDKVRFADDNKELYSADLGIAMGKDDLELVQKVNTALGTLRQNGEYKKIYESYFGSIK